MADTPLSERLIKGFVKEAKEPIVNMIGGLIAFFAAHNAPYAFWGTLAIWLGVFVVYNVIVCLLQRTWARRSPN